MSVGQKQTAPATSFSMTMSCGERRRWMNAHTCRAVMGNEDQSVVFGSGKGLAGDGLRRFFEASVVIPETKKAGRSFAR
jgi:hypothetical protein